MSEKNKPFVITDRRKFSADGTPRPDADPSPEREPDPHRNMPGAADTTAPASSQPLQQGPQAVPDSRSPEQEAHQQDEAGQDTNLPPMPTAEQMRQANAAYTATADRLDTAVRAANPGMQRPPEMSFEQIVQSVYINAIMQLGGNTPEGQQPQVDLMGARQSVDMLGVLEQKTAGNLAKDEERLLSSALFELRMAFLDITQALARQAAAKNPSAFGGPAGPGSPAGFGGPAGPGGPRIVR